MHIDGATGRRVTSRVLQLLLFCGVGLVCGAAECDGGARSCRACQDDCAAHNIPPSQCNCQGCTPP